MCCNFGKPNSIFSFFFRLLGLNLPNVLVCQIISNKISTEVITVLNLCHSQIFFYQSFFSAGSPEQKLQSFCCYLLPAGGAT